MVCVLNPEWPHGGGAVIAGMPLFQTLVVTEGLMSLWGGKLKQAGLHGVNVGVNRRFVSVPGPDQFKKKDPGFIYKLLFNPRSTENFIQILIYVHNHTTQSIPTVQPRRLEVF